MHPRLGKIAHDLRAAILAGEHSGAARLVTEYVEALCGIWDSLPVQERVVSEIPRQALELLAWARAVTITQHVLAAEQLAIVEKVIRYRQAGPPEARSGAVAVSG